MKKTNLQPLSCNKNSIEIKILWKQKYCEKNTAVSYLTSRSIFIIMGSGTKADSVLRKKSKVKQIFCVFVDDSSVVCVY